MEFCLIYPNKKPYCDPVLAGSVAAAAETAGFHTLLTWDHYSLPSGPETLDAWNLLTFIAARTSRIRLGTCVTPIPLRPPALLAKQVASVDVLSGGRVTLGVGAGWHQPEFDSYSHWDSVGVRVSRTIEGLELILKMWRGDGADFRGRYYTALDPVLEPSPVQKPHPPLWFGVMGERMLRLAARYAQAWIPTEITPEEYGRVLRRVQAYRLEVGVPGEVKGALQLMHPYDRAADYLSSIEEFWKVGCRYYGIVWTYPPKEMMDRVRWFAREVMVKKTNG